MGGRFVSGSVAATHEGRTTGVGRPDELASVAAFGGVPGLCMAGGTNLGFTCFL